MKVFTTTGACNPEKNYMVDLSARLEQIKAMVDAGQYFTINKARQYGKTTTLAALESFLQDSYVVLYLDFQGLDYDAFQTGDAFTRAFAQMLVDENEFHGVEIPPKYLEALEEITRRDGNTLRLMDLFRVLTRWCSDSVRPIVMMIDEFDYASNNQVFLDFLSQLRKGYLGRETKGTPTFQSVILAGVTDVRNLKRKLRPDEEGRLNSPWNIAADFNVEMSLSEAGIEGMLLDYENDHHTGMDISRVATEIHDWTDGYPYLVSRICQRLDTRMPDARFTDPGAIWTVDGVSDAVKQILMEKNMLFDSLMGKVYGNATLSHALERILFSGDAISYNPYSEEIFDAQMYGLIKNKDGYVAIANRIFESLLYNYFLNSDTMLESPMFKVAANDRGDFVRAGKLQMDTVMEKFVATFHDLYPDPNEKFSEDEGRKKFLLFVRAIINGTGNYYIEAETRSNGRMDLVIDYLGIRHVVELKIWRGKAYHEAGEKQLAGYLEDIHLDKGYLLTYSFNRHKETNITTVTVSGKILVEVFV